MQQEFRKSWLITGTLLAYAVLFFRTELNRLPNRTELGPRTATVTFEPISLGVGSGPRLQVIGAWRLFADDPRFGGLSGLAVEGDSLIAVTDSGVVVRFPKPKGSERAITLAELPGGPGNAGFKVNRDAEALVADAQGRGWWIAFENRDQVWLYDRSFTRILTKRQTSAPALGRNRGIEGMVATKDDILLFTERGQTIVTFSGRNSYSLAGISGWISDAARLPDGSLIVANRRLTGIGLKNRLVFLRREEGVFRPTASWTVPVGRLDNVEGIAAEPRRDGVTRLWIVTDNNFQQRRPTLLIAVDLKPPPRR